MYCTQTPCVSTRLVTGSLLVKKKALLGCLTPAPNSLVISSFNLYSFLKHSFCHFISRSGSLFRATQLFQNVSSWHGAAWNHSDLVVIKTGIAITLHSTELRAVLHESTAIQVFCSFQLKGKTWPLHDNSWSYAWNVNQPPWCHAT